MEKLAYAEKRKDNKPKKKDYVPEALLGASLALYLADASKRGFKAPLEPIAKGFKNFPKYMAMPKPLKALTEVGFKTNKLLTFKKDAFNEFLFDYNKRNGLPQTTKHSAQKLKELYHGEFKKSNAAAQKFVNDTMDTFIKDNGLEGKRKFNNTERLKFEEFLKDTAKSNKIDSDNFGGIDFKKLSPKQVPTKKMKMDSVMEGIGTGAGFGLTNLAIHSVGDKYFGDKDNERVREAIRNSYSLGTRPWENTQTRANNFMTKGASAGETIVDGVGEAAEALKKEGIKEKLKKHITYTIPDSFLNGLISVGIPTAASLAISKDVRNNFSDIKPTSNQSEIIIDVPYNEPKINKSAGLEDVKKAVKASVSKIKNDPDTIKFWEDKERRLVGALPWAAGPSIVYLATGKDIKNPYPEVSEESLPPVQEGYVRMRLQIPQTNRNYDYDMMKVSRDENLPEELIQEMMNDIARDMEVKSGGNENDLARNERKLGNMTLSEGQAGKSKNFNMLPGHGMNP